jgi:hypothetical protein
LCLAIENFIELFCLWVTGTLKENKNTISKQLLAILSESFRWICKQYYNLNYSLYTYF